MGAQPGCNIPLETASQASAIHVSVAARCDIGRVRRKNEDAFLVADLTRGEQLATRSATRIEVGDRGVLLVVSDGMGGHRAGEIASSLVVQGLARALEASPRNMAPVAQLKYAAAQAHLDVAAAARRGGREGMGATLTAAHIRGNCAYIAEVGDSRAYVIRAGAIRQLTRDQSVAQLLSDNGAIRPDEARTSPMRNVLAQAMGQQRAVKVALGKLELRDRDCLVLCTDGLTGVLGDQELRDTILGSKDLDAACERLVATANSRSGDDNVTVVLAGIGGALPACDGAERVSRTYEILETFAPIPQKPEAVRWLPATVKITP